MTQIIEGAKDWAAKFEQGWIYPQRPLLTNKRYPYVLLNMVDPGCFAIKVDDPVTTRATNFIELELKKLKKAIDADGSYKPMDIQLLKEMMPVVYNEKGRCHRAEVNLVNRDKGQVNVTLVDLGKVKCVAAKDIFHPTVELLRYHKLALLCGLSHIVPPQGQSEWLVRNYEPAFRGTQRFFSIAYADENSILEVHLECDGVDVGYKMVMSLGIAEFIPLLPDDYNNGGKSFGKFPRYNYADWIGQRIPVFGTKVVVVKNQVKVHLQLDPTYANEVWEKVEEYVQTLSDSKDENFPKQIGDPVLVTLDDENLAGTYRATIVKKSTSEFLVKLVDFGDIVNVEEKNLMKIPEHLVELPEGATFCLIAELQKCTLTENMIELLKELIQEKDLLAVIGTAGFVDAEDPNGDNLKCVVSLLKPIEGKDGAGTPFSDILKLPSVHYIQQLAYILPNVNQSLAQQLLNVSYEFLNLRKYHGLLSWAEDKWSVYLQLEGHDFLADRLTEELTRYFQLCGKTELTAKEATAGLFVAARQSVEADEKWYRAKILDVTEDGKYAVQFLDYGNYDILTLDKIKPLISYFAMNKCLSFRAALPINTTYEKLYSLICATMEVSGQVLTVYLQREGDVDYAWIMYGENRSLVHELIKAGLGAWKFNPNPQIKLVV